MRAQVADTAGSAPRRTTTSVSPQRTLNQEFSQKHNNRDQEEEEEEEEEEEGDDWAVMLKTCILSGSRPESIAHSGSDTATKAALADYASNNVRMERF
nr:unnamed protein product [Spirometra erinaceieuropaei]